MSFKRLHSDSRIEGILDAISYVTGETYEDVNTAQMATLIRNIHQGAKSVWIGTQLAYNQLDPAEIDVEIAYIILESGNILRVYAGSTIIYDVPIIWNYSLSNEIMSGSRSIDTGLQIQFDTVEDMNAVAWEYIMSVNSFNPSLYNVTQSMFADGFIFTPRWENGNQWDWIGPRGTGHNIIKTFTSPETPYLKYRARKNVNDVVNIFWIDEITGEETLIGSQSPTGTDRGRNMQFKTSYTGLTSYTIEDFRFRWLT